MAKRVKKQPLECCYAKSDGAYTRVNCTEIDRGMTPVGNVKDSMDNGTLTFVNDKNEVLAECPPNRLSWVRLLRK